MMMILPALVISAPVRAEGDAWTVMVYLDGDNNVESYAAMDLQELQVTGSSADVNIVVLWDPLSGPANLLYVNKGSTTTLAAWGEVNMGDPATLTRFITDSKALYPATRNALVLWNHGGGITGLCWDDTSSSDKLTMPELRSGIANGGLAFDVVVFNACVMAVAEVAHQIQGYAGYVVFSQENMYAVGFPYDKVAADLEADSAMDGRTMALMMAQDYVDFYAASSYSSVTISVYDMTYLGSVAGAVNTFANAQIATMATYYKTYKSIRQSVPAPNNAADLYRYAQLVSTSTTITSTTVKSAASGVMSAVDAAIIYEWHTADITGENGLGIWFPTKSVTYYWSASMETMYRAMPFDQAAGWANFLDSYYNKG